MIYTWYPIHLCIVVCLTMLPDWSFSQQSPIAIDTLEQAHIKAIHTAEELASIGQKPEFPLDGVYSLENDLDLRELDFCPIGNAATPFQGTLYGNHHVLMHGCIKCNQENTGLFGVVGQKALIQELYIKDGWVQGKANTGLLVGCNQGVLQYCYARGQVAGSDNVGGLVGINMPSGRIEHAQFTGTIKGRTHEIGGLVGCNLGYILASRAQAIVEGVRLVGGLVGTNDETGQILHCVALGTIQGKYWVGGLVGHNWFKGQVIHCIAKATVIGQEYVGGLVGCNYAQACISKSSSAGTVTGNKHTGQFVGSNSGMITYNLDITDTWRNRLEPQVNAWP